MKNYYLRYGLLLFSMLACQFAYAQITVSGLVTDAMSGEPLIGVNVIDKQTKQGVVTNLEGEYTITLPNEQGTLVFSFVGYLSEEIKVTSSTRDLNVGLVEDIASLEEVVVTGLASGVKRSNLANAVATVSAEELMGNTTPQTLDNAMYGKIAGVNMNANGGAPGGGISVQMRGISTLGAGSSQPLYIIDGVYVDNSSMRSGRTQVSGASGGQAAANQDDASNRIADLNPDDIERIEVLKGPSAAAIYGTRANAGVIIITTKRGKEGETSIKFNQDIGFAKGQNFQNFDAWGEDKILTFYGSGETGQAELEKYRNAKQQGRVYNWEEVLYGETGLLSNSQLSMSGGSAKTQFYVSGGAQTEEGIIKNTGFNRYSVRANINHALSSAIDLNLNTTYTRSETARGFTGNQNNTGGSIGYALAYTPSYADLMPDEQGNYPDNEYFNDNPLAIRDLATNNLDVDRFISAFGMNADLLSSSNYFLKFSMNGGVDYVSGNSLVHFPEILQHQRNSANPGDVMWGRQDNTNMNLQGFLTFNANLQKTNLNSQLGVVHLNQSSEYLLQRGRGLAGGQTNLRWAKVVSTQDQARQRVSDLGLVAQQEANWDDKVVGTLGVRLDKSTLNYQQNKFYAFPKASVAVNLTNFDFWNFETVNQFKIRAAYGETGGLPMFGNTFESLTPQLIGGYLGGMVGTRGVDPNLRPETAAELEVGFDLSLFDNRISLEATAYNKRVRDLILDLQPAESTGILAIATNAADLQNRGVELGLTLVPVRTQNLFWQSQILFWKNRSKITDLQIPTQTVGGFGPALGSYLLAEGYSPTTIVGTPADPSVPGGFTVYGDRQPNFDLSFFNNITLMKNLDFNFLFHWKDGGQNINLSALLWDDGGTTPNWNGDSDGDGTPNGLDRLLGWAVDGNTGVYIQDASYLKLREIGLYYTLPQSTTNTFLGSAFKNLKLGVSGNNFLLWTNYGSYDPEVSNFGSQPISSNIEVTPYPSSRRIFFHLNFEL